MTTSLAVGASCRSASSSTACGGPVVSRTSRAASLTAVVADRLEPPGRIGHSPFEVAVARHRLAPERTAVEQQLDLLGIAVRPDLDRLALAARPVPVRQQMHQRPVGPPPRAVVIIIVLGEAAGVEDSELRADAREGVVGRRLAAIVEAGPDEAAGDVRPVGDDRPPFLGGGRPPRMLGVVGADDVARRVVGIFAARRDRASGLRAVDRLLGMARVIGLDLVACR